MIFQVHPNVFTTLGLENPFKSINGSYLYIYIINYRMLYIYNYIYIYNGSYFFEKHMPFQPPSLVSDCKNTSSMELSPTQPGSGGSHRKGFRSPSPQLLFAVGIPRWHLDAGQLEYWIVNTINRLKSAPQVFNFDPYPLR